MQSRIIKAIIFISFFMGSVFFLKQPVFATHGSYSASIPDSIEHRYTAACPGPSSSGYTVHGVYPTAAIVSSATRAATVQLNAASYLCEFAGYSSVTNIKITVTDIVPINTTATMSLPSSTYTFNVGNISAKKTFAGPVSATATVTGLTATSTNQGRNCFNVSFYAVATVGTSPQTSDRGTWQVCVTWYPKVKVTSFTLDPHTWERDTLAETETKYPFFVREYDVSLQAYINGAWNFNLQTNLSQPTTANPANYIIQENIGPGQMRAWVDIPDGFRIRRIYINGSRQSEAVCGTSYCIVEFNIFNYSAQDEVRIEFDYVKLMPPYFQICPTSTSLVKFAKEDFYFAVGEGIDIRNNNEWLYGYVFDAFAHSEGKRILINIKDRNGNNSNNYYWDTPVNSVKFAGDDDLVPFKGRPWALKVPDGKRIGTWEARGSWDAEGSVATNYLAMTGNPVTWGPGFANDCNINFYLDPISWLKTEKGNVVSSTGYIRGFNAISSSSQSNIVQSTVAGLDKAEYLVIAKAGAGFNFCSTYRYQLTNINSSSNCGTGSGYTSLNSYDLNINVGGAQQDSVVAAVKKAADSMPGCLVDITPENVGALTDSGGIQVNPQPSCPNGTVYRITPSPGSDVNLPAIPNVNRRATILINGNAIINGNISYSTTATVNDYKYLQSLAIVAGGDIRIKGAVTIIKAALYSAGKINTCYEPAARAAELLACNSQLVVDGMLVGKGGFQFQRTRSFIGIRQYDDPLNLRVNEPSEQVNFDPRIVINPPPGLDILNFYKATGYKYLLDKAEYAPRF